MVSRQDALLNLSRLLSHGPGVDPEVHGEGLLTPTDDQLRDLDLRLEGPLSWTVTVRGTGGDDDFIAEGEVSGTAIMECRRCLTDVPAEVDASFLYPMIYRPAKDGALELLENPGGDPEDVDEDVLSFGKPQVDFAPLLRQVFAIDLPLTALCRESCRGLSVDGVNLNEHPDHVAAEVREGDSPFAALEGLDLDEESDTDS